MGDCIRTGMCCQRLPIKVSPRQMREAFEEWQRRGQGFTPLTMIDNPHNAGYRPVYRDIWLIYPMLKGRCLGKIHMPNPNKAEREKPPAELTPTNNPLVGREDRAIEWSYIYGPCRFFERTQVIDGRLVGGCSIHDMKPDMCSSYPNGNSGTFRGCGYNAGTENGVTFDEIAKLEPLTEDEK